MGTELAVRADVVNSLEDIQRIAKMFLATGYFDVKGRDVQGVAELATKILAGRELGFSPFASVSGIHVVQGKPTIGGNLMAAAVKSSPKYDYRIRQMDEAACKIEFLERTPSGWDSLGVSTFSADDAKKAGTQNMAKYARNMLFNRAMSNGVRWYCPDVFDGVSVYTEGELGGDVDIDTGEIIEAVSVVIEPTPVTQATLKAMHAAGKTYAGGADNWKAVGPDYIKAAVGVAPAELTEEQASEVLDRLTAAIAETELVAA